MTREDKKAHAKDALLEAAKVLFIEKGYEAVSTRELAETAGVNLGAIQYHFGSKAKLFVETVRNLMAGGRCVEAEEALQGECGSPVEAGIKLARYIAAFLNYLLRHEGPQPCRMMIREVFTNTSSDFEMMEALTSSVVNEFIRPMQQALVDVIASAAPDLPRESLDASSASIVGQCFFYVTNRPFIHRLRGFDPGEPGALEEIARHITGFSLRGLGCEQSLVDEVLSQAFPKKKSKIVFEDED